MLENSQQNEGRKFGGGNTQVQFLEEVNYKMEESEETTQVNYVMLENIDREKEAKNAFKKKRKESVKDFELSWQQDYTLVCE